MAKVTATNLVGSSPVSEEGNGAVIVVFPDVPLNLRNDDTITNADQAGLLWEEGASNGGTPVLDYRVWLYDEASGSDQVLVSNVLGTAYTHTGLTQGTTYTYKVQARNAYGYSGMSEPTSILASALPSKPRDLLNDPSVTDAGQIGMVWTAPITSGGSPVQDYMIEYDNAQQTWSELASNI